MKDISEFAWSLHRKIEAREDFEYREGDAAQLSDYESAVLSRMASKAGAVVERVPSELVVKVRFQSGKS